MSKRNFNIINRTLYSVLETKTYGDIVFGCPPGIVKDFLKVKKSLPLKYVIPSQTFCNNINNFDFEFIVYSVLFTKAPGSTVSVYCLPEQEKRCRVILNETLFGPKFDQLLDSQSNKLLNEKCLNEDQRKKLQTLISKNIAKNKKISILFDNLLSAHSSESKTKKHIKQFIEDKILSKTPSIANTKITNLSNKLTKIYIQCAQLQKEFNLFSLAKERNRNSFISKIIKFHHIKKTGVHIINGLKDKRKKIKIQEVESSVFKVIEGEEESYTIKLNSINSSKKKHRKKIFKTPFFGVTFIGVGSGFSVDKQNSSLIVWAEDKGILIDIIADNNLILSSYGINNNAINHVFLTHIHSDHDAGAIENLLEEKKTYLITSRIIYESFLRKAQALTSLSKNNIEKFVKLIEVIPKQKIKIPGFTNTFFEFDYSLHSIPTGRCKITYSKGNTKKIISHSGDTKYDIPKIDTWFDKGSFTQNRKNDLLGFIWDADLIIHDVGGGILHTNYESLLHLDKKTKQKTVLVHQNEKPQTKSQFRYAIDGETISLIK
jgi:hypothetical protein